MSALTLHTFLSTTNLKELHELSVSLLSKIEQLEKGNSINTDELNDFNNVKNSFIEIYQIIKPGLNNLEIQQNSSSTTSVSSSSSSKNDLINSINEDFVLSFKDNNKLINIINLIKENNWLNSNFDEIKLLTKIMIIYLIIIYMIESSKLLIDSTLTSFDNINYYDCILSKKYTVLLYFIQTLPINIYSIIKDLENYLIPKLDSNEIPNWIPKFSRNFYSSIFGYFKFFYKLIKLNINNFIESPTNFLIESKSESKSLFNKFWNSTFRLPYFYSKFQIELKRKNLINLQRDNISKIGYLLTNSPNNLNLNVNNNNLIINNNLLNVNTIELNNLKFDNNEFQIDDLLNSFDCNLTDLKLKLNEILIKNEKPSYLIRNWPIILPSLFIIGSYLPLTIKNIKLLITDSNSRIKLINYFKNLINYLIETIKSFWNNWILNPINNILKTIRHDNNSEIALMSQQSLNSDLESLERMTIDYINDLNYNNLDISEIKNLVKSGDMTLIMNNYENDLKTPIKSIIIGDMIRNILIQIQKTKVDGSLALNGVDKILKSQELVFGFVAASPSLFILWNLKNSFINWFNGNNENSYKKIHKTEIKARSCKSLGNIEKIIDYLVISDKGKEDNKNNSNNYYKNGLLFIELRNLKKLTIQILPNYIFNEFINDIEELIDNNLSNYYKLLLIQRIWNVYGGYFK